MTYANYDDIVAQLQAAGLVLDRVQHTYSGIPEGALYISSTQPIRTKIDGADGEWRGWYHLGEFTIEGALYITGAYGIWQGADNGKQSLKLNLNGKAIKVSADERAAIKARNETHARMAAAQRKRETNIAAAKAEHVWRHYIPSGDSDYLTRKNVGAHGLRFSPNNTGTVAVPMLRADKIVGLQIIRGKKREPRKLEKEYFPAGMDKGGAYHLLGRILMRGPCIVAEGYATGASIYESLGKTIPVAIAFDAGSLGPVSRAIARIYRSAKIIIAADDDRIQKCGQCGKPTAVDLTGDLQTATTPETLGGSISPTHAPADAPAHTPTRAPSPSGRCVHCNQFHGKDNPGIRFAQTAAFAVSGTWLAPAFTVERRNDQKGLNDFNDLHCAEGLHAVRAQFEAHIAGLNWATAEAPQQRPGAIEGAGPPQAGEGGAKKALQTMLTIDEACERWSLIYGSNGNMFDHQEHMLVTARDALSILPDHASREWKLHPSRRVVRLSEVGFDPAGTDPNIRCNLWSGWPTTAREGTCTALLSVLEHLCSAEPNGREIYKWCLKWLAYPIQHPGAKMRTTLVFHGPQRVGKNLFFESIMRIYERYGRIVDQAAVEDKFNDYLSGKLFLIADEVCSTSEVFHLKNKLKGIITGEWVRINPKTVAAHDERNHVNLVFLSNDTRPVIIEPDDGRHVVVWTPAKMPIEYYAEVAAEIKAGGIEALHHYLLNLDLDGFTEHSPPPMTKSKADLIDMSMGSVERYLRDWQEGHISIDDTTIPLCPCGSQDAYNAYRRWCLQEGVQRPREQVAFIGTLAKLPGWQAAHKDRYSNEAKTGSTVRQRFIVPSPAALQAAAMAKESLDYRKPDAATQTTWLTDCFFAFKNALGGPK